MLYYHTSKFTYLTHSEEKLGVNSARGWEGDSDKKMRGRQLRGEESDLEEFSDFDEDYDEEESSLAGEESFKDVVSPEERQKIEMQFERTLDEYGDEELGELEDVSLLCIASRPAW